jgi:hypothetical protein
MFIGHFCVNISWCSKFMQNLSIFGTESGKYRPEPQQGLVSDIYLIYFKF